jgi:hypothetical protein
MPQIVTCPDCGRKLRVPDALLGKKVKCPGCGQKFVGEADEDQDDSLEPAGRGSNVTSRPGDSTLRQRDEEEDDAPRSSRGRDEGEDEDYPVSRRRKRDDDNRGPEPTKGDIRQGWERVRFGVNLIILAVWIGVGTVVVAVSGWMLLILFGVMSFSTIASSFPTSGPPTQQNATQAAGQAAGTGAAMIVGGCLVGGLILLLLLAQLGSRLTGLGFCMGIAATRKTQMLKGLAIAVFSIAVANLILPTASLGVSIPLARNGVGCIGFAGEGLFGALSLAEIICFLLFLRGVAAVMKKDNLAQNIVFYMIALPIYGLTLVVLPFIFFCGGGMAILGAGAAAGANAPPGSGPMAPSAAVGNMAGAGAAVLIGGITCVGVEILIGLALFIWYIVLLYQVRYAVDGWLSRN